MRGTIVAVAVVLYAAAFAVFGAALRLPAAATPSPSLVPSPVPPAPPQAPSAAAAPADEQVRLTMRELAREQAANREVVAELRSTVAQLERQLGRERARADEPAGRTVAALGGSLFAPGQVALTPAARDAVRRLLPEVQAEPALIVSVEGHSDSRPVRAPVGKPFKDNADLSLLRARAVAAVLREGGVPESRLRIAGWGDTRPLASNDTAEGRERNRRVEIRLLPAAQER